MYYPYFRGKQYELVMLREMAETLGQGNVVPIIEPVKSNTASLEKCLAALREENVPFILVLNPRHGDFKTNNLQITDEIIPSLEGYDNFQIGYIIDKDSELSGIRSELQDYPDNRISLIHFGYPDGQAVADMLISNNIELEANIFVDNFCGQRYKMHFRPTADTVVLIKDSFNKCKNADYTSDEPFSELHLIYEEEGYDGFGDFSIVGDEYSESGGPAYAVAIHITYFRADEEINVRHYVSDRRDSPVDPAGKFIEALAKLVVDIEEEDSVILQTTAIQELITLYEEERFPGLGYLKKLSMRHHLELILSYLRG